MTSSPSSHPSLTRRLAQMIRRKEPSDQDRLQAERFVRDWLGSFVAGGPTEPGRALSAYGSAARDLESRVFLAAALSHITETDDLHKGSVTHPACVVVPTALLLGHEEGLEGVAILNGVLAGYEAMIRVGSAVGPAHYHTFHTTATAGVFGAAATAAQMLDLEEEEWVWAFGNAGTQAAGLWEFRTDASMSKHLHPGHAAAAGLRSALLGRHGFTGPETILEGDHGFLRGLCPDPNPEALLEPAPRWKLLDTSLKPYPCCGHIHPAIAAALEVKGRLDSREGTGAAAKVENVHVKTYTAGLHIVDAPDPRTSYDAKFSMQFCVAAALVLGEVDLELFEERLEDPRVRRLAAKIRVTGSPSFDARYPEQWGAEVTVQPSGGGKAVSSVRTEAPGDPAAPLSDEDLNEKVVHLLEAGGLGEAETEELLRDCRHLPENASAFALPWPPETF